MITRNELYPGGERITAEQSPCSLTVIIKIPDFEVLINLNIAAAENNTFNVGAVNIKTAARADRQFLLHNMG